MTYIIETSNDYPDLARSEIENLLETDLKMYVAGFYFIKKEIELSKLKRLGLTRRVYNVLQEINSGSEEDFFNQINLNLIKSTYKITVIGIEGINKSTKEIADKLHSKLNNPKVDLTNPKHHYVILWSLTEIRICEEIYVNTDKPHDRRSHLKKHNHPTSIHPKVAKAMINLVAKESFVDPFCGAGGIAIEGGLMGLNVKGYDIDEIMIKRARDNSKEYDVHILFEKKDALKLDESCESIVTDLPYGKNSLISKDLIKLYEEFFIVANRLTDKIVVGSHEDTDISAYLDDTQWEIKKEFRIYVHKTMTRVISVLEKSVEDFNN